MRSFLRSLAHLFAFVLLGGLNNSLHLLGDPAVDHKAESFQFITWSHRQDQ